MFVDFTYNSKTVSIDAHSVVAVLDEHNDNPGKCMVFVGSAVDNACFIVDGSREECLAKVIEARLASARP